MNITNGQEKEENVKSKIQNNFKTPESRNN